ncbi:MAG: pitrilysin family protein [Rhodospirillaceae bacterium]|nr:pitrilysin family protein [Rhodospirillaceae bacterium]
MSGRDDLKLTRLPSGLTVLSDRMTGVETVSLGVWVNAGTRHETADVNGVSHLLEHMAFKGTERRSAMAIAEEIEAVGGQINAYTSREHTAYYAKVLKEDKELAIDIIADILQHSALDPDELAREEAVVAQEIAQAIDTPDDIIFDHVQSTAYPGQAVGRPVLGTAEIVRAMPRNTVASYMRAHYGASRMVLTAAGAIEHEELLDAAGRHFAALPDVAPPVSEPARYVGGDFRESRDIEQVHLVLAFDGVSFRDEDFYAASVLSTLLGGGMSSRLFQEVRERRGLAYSVYSFTSSYEDGGLFEIYAGTGESEAAEVIPVLCEEVMKVTAKVSAEEVARARAQIRAGVLMSLESSGARCEQAARQTLALDRLVPTDEVIERIDAVDEAAVIRVARRLFQGTPTFAAIGPQGGLDSFDAIRARLG